MLSNDPTKVSTATIRRLASSLPDVEEGVACEGTALERRTFKARKKAFLFLGSDELLLKLDGSLGEARALGARKDAAVAVGKNGWVKVTLSGGVAREVMDRWIRESYELFAAKTASNAGAMTGTAKKTAKKNASPRKATAKKATTKKAAAKRH